MYHCQYVTSLRRLCVIVQITSYGGQLAYTVYSDSSYGGSAIEPGPDVVIHVRSFCYLLLLVVVVVIVVVVVFVVVIMLIFSSSGCSRKNCTKFYT